VRSAQLDRSCLDKVNHGDPLFNLLSLNGAGQHLPSLDTMVAIQSLEFVPISLQKHIAHLESQLCILVEKQAITDLLNSYAEELDKCGADTSNWSRGWEGNFHPEAHIAYPFGERHGGKGVGKWASATMKQFINYHHLSSNFQIKLDGPDQNGEYETAKGRSNLQAYHMFDEVDQWNHFAEGGYYLWGFRKNEDGVWKIIDLDLRVTWKVGKDVLNDQELFSQINHNGNGFS